MVALADPGEDPEADPEAVPAATLVDRWAAVWAEDRSWAGRRECQVEAALRAAPGFPPAERRPEADSGQVPGQIPAPVLVRPARPADSAEVTDPLEAVEAAAPSRFPADPRATADLPCQAARRHPSSNPTGGRRSRSDTASSFRACATGPDEPGGPVTIRP